MAQQMTAQDLANATGITEEEASQCIYQYDEDGEGTLNEDDYNDLRDQILAQQREQITNKLNANDIHSAIDADGDGLLDAEELAKACNITEEEAKNIIFQYDEDGDGKLNPDEFEDLKQQILSQQRENMTDKLSHNQMHDDIDVNSDGKLSATELSQACNITEIEAKNIILQYDQDGDGMLDPDEFEDLKQQILSQQRENMTDKISANDTFEDIDANSDKKLSAKELADACNISELEAKNIIEQYDEDNDGMLNENEFENLKQKILAEQKEKERLEKIKNDRAERQRQQQQQYNQNNIGNDDDNKQDDNDNDNVQHFKHKWKFGMNFDPKNENVVIYISDEISKNNWGITLGKNDFNGPIRQEYRKLGGVVSNATIKYDYPSGGNGALGVHIIGKNNENYNYQCAQQI